MPKEVYLPDSDCECYYQALDLLNEALEPIDERITALEQNTPDPQYSGVSTEPKPSDVAENSIYLELDTGKFYYYHDNEWHEMDCSCSGGGGSSNIKHVFVSCDGTLDDDFEEASAIVQNGGKIIASYRNEEYESTGFNGSGAMLFSNGRNSASWFEDFFATDYPVPKKVIPLAFQYDENNITIEPEGMYYMAPTSDSPNGWIEVTGVAGDGGIPYEIYPDTILDYVEDYCVLVYAIISEKSSDYLTSTRGVYMRSEIIDVDIYPWDDQSEQYDMNNPYHTKCLTGGSYRIVSIPNALLLYKMSQGIR